MSKELEYSDMESLLNKTKEELEEELENKLYLVRMDGEFAPMVLNKSGFIEFLQVIKELKDGATIEPNPTEGID